MLAAKVPWAASDGVVLAPGASNVVKVKDWAEALEQTPTNSRPHSATESATDPLERIGSVTARSLLKRLGDVDLRMRIPFYGLGRTFAAATESFNRSLSFAQTVRTALL